MKHLVTLMCGHQIMGHTPGQRFCNKKCVAFHLRRSRKKKSPSRATTRSADYHPSNDAIWLEKGKRRISNGYIDLSMWSEACYRQVSRREHIVVWAIVHGQELPRDWCVHHIDENRANNSPENLLGMPRGMHIELHRRLETVKAQISSTGYVIKRHEVTKEYLCQLAEMMKREITWYN